MSDLLIGALSALLATNQPAALSNLVRQQTGLALTVPDKNDPVEKEYQRVLALDDEAQAEAQLWKEQSDQLRGQPGGLEATLLRGKIRQRYEPVRKAYDDFLRAHPEHARARLAYGSFLSDIGEEDAALAQWQKSAELDPKNPAAWNNLANFYGHHGPVTNAFACYARALALQPGESLYYQNFATTVFLFRRDAMQFFGITEPQVFEKSFALYRKARELDPENFVLATDYAQSYYAFTPKAPPSNDVSRAEVQKNADAALAAWADALKIAPDENARQGVHIHTARWQINSGRFDHARQTLARITNSALASTVKALTNKISKLEAGVRSP